MGIFNGDLRLKCFTLRQSGITRNIQGNTCTSKLIHLHVNSSLFNELSNYQSTFFQIL